MFYPIVIKCCSTFSPHVSVPIYSSLLCALIHRCPAFSWCSWLGWCTNLVLNILHIKSHIYSQRSAKVYLNLQEPKCKTFRDLLGGGGTLLIFFLFYKVTSFTLELGCVPSAVTFSAGFWFCVCFQVQPIWRWHKTKNLWDRVILVLWRNKKLNKLNKSESVFDLTSVKSNYSSKY